MLSTWALIVCSLSTDCLSACSKPSRIGWFASCMVWTRCSYVSASSASLMEPLSFSFPLFLSQVSSRCQDRLAIIEKKLLPEFEGLEVDRLGLGRNAHENVALGVDDRFYARQRREVT